MKNSTFLIVLFASFLSSFVQASHLHLSSKSLSDSIFSIVPLPIKANYMAFTMPLTVASRPSAAGQNQIMTPRVAPLASFMTSVTDLHYIWLNLTGDNGLFCQMAFGYRPEATNGVDDYDASRIDGQFTLNTLIDSSVNDYVIQSRALPFTLGDVVHLSAKFPVSGTFTINIDHTMGMFTSSQDIIIRDKLTGTVHNLATSGYTFTANAGYFTSRFVIVYQNALAIDTINYQNDVAVYKNNSALVVDASNHIISEIAVYDLQGRLLTKKENVNASSLEFAIASDDKFLIVATKFDEGTTITKKVVQ